MIPLHRQFHFQIDIPTQMLSYKHTDKKKKYLKGQKVRKRGVIFGLQAGKLYLVRNSRSYSSKALKQITPFKWRVIIVSALQINYGLPHFFSR